MMGVRPPANVSMGFQVPKDKLVGHIVQGTRPILASAVMPVGAGVAGPLGTPWGADVIFATTGGAVPVAATRGEADGTVSSPRKLRQPGQQQACGDGEDRSGQAPANGR